MDWTSALVLFLTGSYLLANLIAMAMYASDKRRARKDAIRIPERSLLLAALIGPFGAWTGMRLFHHKTRKALFRLVPLFALLHLLLFVLIYRGT
jgi:uncharacterized membrane protein YsdA (DUF1294 family)